MKVLSIGCVALLLSVAARSQGVDIPLRDLNHRIWTAAEGAPDYIYTIAQAADGTLWLGATRGLFRFDGMKFEQFSGFADKPFEAGTVRTILATPDGGLWIGDQWGRVALLKDGKIVKYGVESGLPGSTVLGLVRDRDGTMWAATQLGLFYLHGNRWERFKTGSGLPTDRWAALKVDRYGNLWGAQSGRALRRSVGASDFRVMAEWPKSDSEYGTAIAEDPAGNILVMQSRSPSVLFDSRTSSTRRMMFFDNMQGAGSLFDQDGNLWFSDPKGIHRITSRKWENDQTDQELIRDTETLDARPGENTEIRAILEDREGSIWIATHHELNRLRYNNVSSRASLTEPDDLPAIVAGHNGVQWILSYDENMTDAHVASMRNGALVERIRTNHFSVGCQDTDGSMWFGGAGLGHLTAGAVALVPLPPEADSSEIHALMCDKPGELWISVIRKGVYHFMNDRWERNGGQSELPQATASVMMNGAHAELWFGYTENRIARIKANHVRLYTEADGLRVGNVTALYEYDNGIWVGGTAGLARYDGANFVQLPAMDKEVFTGITGLILVDSGDLWLNGDAGVVHIISSELKHFERDHTYRVGYEQFTHLDGLPGTASSLRGFPTVVRANEGLWFATSGGLAFIDPARIRHNALPPQLKIWSVTTGARRYDVFTSILQLPAHTTYLRIDYTASSLSVPERVRFRYRLIGSEQDWQEAGDRREAIYTNLSPGHYHFTVIASNNDGVWNDTGASLDIDIAAAFYQTGWFYSLCALLALGVMVVLYEGRVRRERNHALERLEERTAERERIARELHDTLLQGIQGLVLRFQAVANRMSRGEPTYGLMESTLDRADQVLRESRDRVKDIRVSIGQEPDLPMAIAAAGEQLSTVYAIPFRGLVEGAKRNLQPIVCEEAMLIVREALANAFTHAGASHIESEITFGKRELRIRIRDDGRGIDAKVLRAGGVPGHWGLLGMRERAKKIRAKLTIWTKIGAGTEVELLIPARLVFKRVGNSGQHLAGKLVAGFKPFRHNRS